MFTILVFALALFAAALISELANRSIVSTTVLFLLVGFFVGPGIFGVIQLQPQSPVMTSLAQFAMYAVLFIGGMELTKDDLARAWKLPTRALAIGLPLTIVGTAVLARYVVGTAWLPALLVGAVLAPTDPVFASAIVGRREIPTRLRDLLNIESGLNDGLALPIVLVLLAEIQGGHAGVVRLIVEMLLGVALGVVVPWLGHWIEQRKVFTVSDKYAPLFALSIGMLVYGLAELTHVNAFLAAFAAGVTVATLQPRFRKDFCDFGELIAELLKLATVMLFGALISPGFLRQIPLAGYMFAVLALVAVRPIALELALHGATLSGRERIAAYWFGPKGFASVVYGIIVLRSGIPGAEPLFRLIAIVVTFSIIAHSSTDVVIARWFREEPAREPVVGAR